MALASCTPSITAFQATEQDIGGSRQLLTLVRGGKQLVPDDCQSQLRFLSNLNFATKILILERNEHLVYAGGGSGTLRHYA